MEPLAFTLKRDAKNKKRMVWNYPTFIELRAQSVWLNFLSMNIWKKLNIEYKNCYILFSFSPLYYKGNLRIKKIWLITICR